MNTWVPSWAGFHEKDAPQTDTPELEAPAGPPVPLARRAAGPTGGCQGLWAVGAALRLLLSSWGFRLTHNRTRFAAKLPA